MMNNEVELWETELSRRQDVGDGLEFAPQSFLQILGAVHPNAQFNLWLEEKTRQGVLEAVEAWVCPMDHCRRAIDRSAVESKVCPNCNTDFQEVGEEPLQQIRYRAIGEINRDISWMIVIHGMNTRGDWQEELSWRMANKFKYSAPVLIYKYGWVTADVLVEWRHRQLVRNLGNRVREAIKFAKMHKNDSPPDIVVHSFGSHLFSKLLDSDEFGDLRFGRIISAGSIIHPNFEWGEHIQSGKIEAVFNHVGRKDKPVRAAQFFIPGTGPSGQKGFSDKAAINVHEPEYGHSSAFETNQLTENLMSGGLWDQYLQNPLSRFCPTEAFHIPKWRPAFAPLRWTTRALCNILFAVFLPISLLIRVLDP